VILPPGIRSSERIKPPAHLVAPAPPPLQPGERVWLLWPKLSLDTKVHHSAKRLHAGRVVNVLVGVQFDDDPEPLFLPCDQWARACVLEE
jgi:hypothetical protein